MKKHLFLKINILLLAASLQACNFGMGMTQKALPAGIAYTDSILQKYESDTPSFTSKSAFVSLSITESIVTEGKKEDVLTPRKSFYLSAAFETLEAGTRTTILAKKAYPLNPDFEPVDVVLVASKDEDGVVTVDDGTQVRLADPEEDYYSYFDLPYIIDNLVNRNSVRYLSSSLKSITEAPDEDENDDETSIEDTQKFNNILTGFNINHVQSTGRWTFSLYSDYLAETDYSDQLGFADSSYTRFFRYSSVDSAKAHTLRYTFDNNMVSGIDANYEYTVEETQEVVRGGLELKVTYGN